MKQYFVYIFSLYLWNLTSSYYIKRFISTPPTAKYGFNPFFVQQDEIGTYLAVERKFIHYIHV